MFELFQDSTEESLKSLKPTQDVEPGFFANAISGTGKLIAKQAAEIPRNISMAVSLVPRAIDELVAFNMGNKGQYKQLVSTENYFKWHDEFFQRSVDYWDPKPNEVGMAGQIVGGVLPTLAQVIASPAFAVANQTMGTATNLAIQDPNLTTGQAVSVGALQGASLALGVWLPATMGNTLGARVGIGVGSNVALGAATRAGSSVILGDSPTAKGFEWDDPVQLGIDAILGGAFGGLSHFVPSMRAQTAADWDKFKAWTGNLKPSEIDALAVLRVAQHKNQDSMPGVPVTPEAVQTHVDRLNSALEKMMRDEPVGEVSRETLQQDIDRAQNLRDTLREQAISRVGQEAYDAGVQAHLASMGDLAPDQIEVERAIAALRIAQDADLREFGARTTQTADEIAAAEQRVRDQVRAQEPFAVDTARQAAAEAQLRHLTNEAERIRVAEGLPRPPIPEAARPPKDITPLDPVAQAQAVGRHIEQKLLETGMQKAEAVANAAIWEAFAKSAHDRYGITPAELMAKFGVDVRRMDSADQLLGAMEQRYNQNVDDYGGTHRPPGPDDGAPAHDLTGKGNVYPDDVYGPNAVRYYGHGEDGLDSRTMAILHSLKGKPNAKVTIYRAIPNDLTVSEKLATLEKQMAAYMRRNIVPDGEAKAGWYDRAYAERDRLRSLPEEPTKKVEINSGDWVTVNRDYAKQHAQSTLKGKSRIISKQVKASEIFTNGDSIHEFGYWPNGSAQTNTPEFKRWFGDSKVVDAQGKPLVVYHGTFDDFTAFRRRTGDIGMHFGTAAAASDRVDYLVPHRKNKMGDRASATVMPVFLSLKNPLRLRDHGFWNAENMKGDLLKLFPNDAERIGPQFGNRGLKTTKDIREFIQSKGYDGIVYRNTGEVAGYAPFREAERIAREAMDAVFPKGKNSFDIEDQKVPEYIAWREATKASEAHREASTDDSYIAFERTQIKSATGNRGTFDPNNPNILYQGKDQPFYSELARQIDTAKTTSAPAKGWKDTIKGLVNKGVVKQTEVEATGLNDWLDLQEGKVTKQQLQDFIAQNGVRVDEVMLGAKPAGYDEAIERYKNAFIDLQYYLIDNERMSTTNASNFASLAARSELSEGQVNSVGPNAQRYIDEVVMARADRLRLEEMNGGLKDSKFSQYQLPGGENYRELLLTLPPNVPKPEGLDPLIRMLSNWPQDAKTAKRPEDQAQLDELNAEWEKRYAAHRGTFQSNHFSQPNILAHIRFNERTDADGKRVLFIEEFQSDWAQKGKKEGFGNQESWKVVDANGNMIANQPTEAEANAIAEQVRAGQTPLQLQTGRGGEPASVVRTSGFTSGPPSAPFVTKTEAWVALSLKRMIRYAAENGFDRIAWTNGEQQVSRYTNALRKQVDVIEWKKTKDGVHLVGYKNADKSTTKINTEIRANALMALERNNDLGFDSVGEAIESLWQNREDWRMRWDVPNDEDDAAIQAYIDDRAHAMRGDNLDFTRGQRSKVVDTTEKESVLSDAIGKAMADKIKNDPNESGVIEGQDIKIDDTGMATFYDRIVPNVANDVLKKLGGQRVSEFDLSQPKPQAPASVNEIARQAENGELFNAPQGWDMVDTGTESTVGAVGRQSGFDITPEVASKALAGLPLFQGGARGAVSFETGKTLIALFDKADKTTFQHETGHVFLEMTKELASMPTASIRAMQDWATISKWLKLEGGDIPREAHEQWARGWEKYLAEGKAPNNALKQAFKRFRDWIIDVYHSLAGIDSPINNQIRGVMARMLESQAKDPVDKGGLDDPRLQTAEYRDALEKMGHEAGWMEVGGSIQRDWGGWEQPGEAAQGEVIGRSKWIPYAEWYARMQATAANMPGVGGGGVRRAVQKAVMGEKMTAQEQRTVTWMLDEHMAELKRWEDSGAKAANPDGDPYEAAVIRADEGIESTPENILNMALIDRARELDPVAMEAIPDNFDDAQFMARVREIIDAKQPAEKIDQGSQQDEGQAQAQTEYVAQRPAAGAGSSPPPPGGTGEAAAGAADMARNEAYRFANENPDLKIRVGENADGTPMYKSLNDYLEEAAMQTELANQDAELFQVAAECLLGVS